MNRAKELMDTIEEQRVIVDEPILTPDQHDRVMGHLQAINQGYQELCNTLHECVHEAADHKKRKLHKMVDCVVEKQKELGLFHRTFRK